MKTAFKLLPLSLLVLYCVAHADMKEANKENFAKVVQQKLDSENGVCLPVKMGKNPYSIREKSLNEYPESRKRLDAMVKAGLLTVKEEPVSVLGNKEEPGFTYTLTEQGKKFKIRKPTDYGISYVFCTGKLKLSKIDKFSEPVENHGHKETRVYFHIKVEDVDDWIKDKSVQDAYRDMLNLDKILTEDSPGYGDLILTNEGWEDKDLYKKNQFLKHKIE